MKRAMVVSIGFGFEFERREGLYSTRLVAALTLPIELANAQPKLRGKNNNIFRIG